MTDVVRLKTMASLPDPTPHQPDVINEDGQMNSAVALINADRVFLTLDGPLEIRWNGFLVRCKKGENIVPQPFWWIWAQNREDVQKGWEELRNGKPVRAPRRRPVSPTTLVRILPSDEEVDTTRFAGGPVDVENPRTREQLEQLLTDHGFDIWPDDVAEAEVVDAEEKE